MIVKITFDGLGGPPVPGQQLFSRETIISPPEKGCKSSIQKFLSSRNSPEFTEKCEVERRYPLGPMEMVDDGQGNLV